MIWALGILAGLLATVLVWALAKVARQAGTIGRLEIRVEGLEKSVEVYKQQAKVMANKKPGAGGAALDDGSF